MFVRDDYTGSKTRLLGFCAILALAAGLTSPAMAQDMSAPPTDGAAPEQSDAAADAQSSDVVITARRRGETLLNAPATIQVVFPEILEQRDISSASQLNGLVAGLTQSAGGPAGGLPSTNFRGVGSNAALFGNESSVAMYQDGFYLGHARDYVTPLYDVDHIEFIKGTQSTLLGKNTTLGAISVVNRRPENSFGFSASYRYNFSGAEGNQVNAMVNVPLGDTLSVRFAGLFNDDNGYVRNMATGRTEAQTRDISGRVSLRWRPTADLDFVLIYQHSDRNQEGQYLEVLADPIGAIRLRALANGQTEFDGIGNRRSYAASDAFNGAPAGRLPFERLTDNRVNFIADWDVGGGINLRAQTAYMRWNDHTLNDNDHVQAHLYDYDNREANRAFSQELRLSSPTDGAFSWLVGAYYYYNNWALERILTYYSPLGLVPNQPPPPADQGILGRSRGTTDNIFDIRTRAYSAFASATYRLGQFSLTGGLRYTHEEKNATIERFGTGFIGTTSFAPIPFTRLGRTDEGLDYDVSLQWRPTDDLQIYLTRSKGSKSGGFQEVPTSLATIEYTDERAFTNEAGIKYDLGGLGNLQLAVFRTTIRDFQTNFTTQLFGVQQTVTGNSDLRTQGVEFTGLLRPMPGLSFSASVAYADAEYLEFLNGTTEATAATFPGMRAPKAPLWSGRLNASYETDVGSDYQLSMSGGMTFNSRAYSQPPNFSSADAPQIDAFQEFDARIAFGHRRQGWEVALIGTNLTNTTYVGFAARIAGDNTITVPSAGLGQRAYFGSVNRPRTIGIQFTFRR